MLIQYQSNIVTNIRSMLLHLQPLAPSAENSRMRVNKDSPAPRQPINSTWGYNVAHT